MDLGVSATKIIVGVLSLSEIGSGSPFLGHYSSSLYLRNLIFVAHHSLRLFGPLPSPHTFPLSSSAHGATTPIAPSRSFSPAIWWSHGLTLCHSTLPPLALTNRQNSFAASVSRVRRRTVNFEVT